VINQGHCFFFIGIMGIFLWMRAMSENINQIITGKNTKKIVNFDIK